MIDDNGVARLATAGRSSIVATPGTPAESYEKPRGYINNYRYSAPEVRWPEDRYKDRILISKESDVYGMGMVAYEASSHPRVSSGSRVESHANP